MKCEVPTVRREARKPVHALLWQRSDDRSCPIENDEPPSGERPPEMRNGSVTGDAKSRDRRSADEDFVGDQLWSAGHPQRAGIERDGVNGAIGSSENQSAVVRVLWV